MPYSLHKNTPSSISATRRLLDHIRNKPVSQEPERAVVPEKKKSLTPEVPFLFGSKLRSSIGIDIANGWLTLAQCSSGPQLQAVQTIKLPEGLDWNSPDCGKFVRDELHRFASRLNETAIWVHLYDGQDELRHYRIPKVGAKEQDTVALMTAKREKPFDDAAYLFDYRAGAEILDKGVPRIPIIAMISNRLAIGKLKTALLRAGITPAGITSGGIASQNVFASGWLSSPWEQFAVVALGFESTRIDIIENNQVALSRTIRAGLHSLTSDLDGEIFEPLKGALPRSALAPGEEEGSIPFAPDLTRTIEEPTVLELDQFEVPALEQESLGLVGAGLREPALTQDSVPSGDAPLRQAGSVGEEQAREKPSAVLFRTDRTADENAKLLEELEAPLSRLARQLERTIAYFRNTMGRQAVQGIVISAPEGCIPLLKDRFESLLGIPCRALLYDGNTTPGALLDLERASANGVDVFQAIGLALSSDVYTPNALMTYQDRQVVSKHQFVSRLALGGLSLGIFLSGVLIVSASFHFFSLQQERKALEAQVAGWGHQVTEAELQSQLAQLQALQSRAATLAKRRVAAALIAELSSITPKGVYLTGMRLTVSDERGDSKKNSQKGSEGVVTILTGTVTGNTLQRESLLAEFLSRLEQSPLVASVLVEKQQNDNETISFVATIRMV